MHKYYIGIDIGGTTSRVSLGEVVNQNITILKQSEIYTTLKYTPNQLIEHFIYDIQSFQKEHTILAVGISCGGPLDSKKGIVLSPLIYQGGMQSKLWIKYEMLSMFLFA